MECPHVLKQIESWLFSQIQKTKQKGFVVGVSGGVDSALVSTLCARSGYPTLLLDLPINQNKKEHSRAVSHIQKLEHIYSNVTGKTLDLTPMLQTFWENIVDDTVHNSDIVDPNLRSRLRMTALYAFANAYGYLVAGTGNRIEDFGIGFFTKFGDGGIDISPIGDLKKSEVRELAAYLGVSKEITDAIPTDGLWEDGRSDEDQIGATYDELEWAMDWCTGEIISAALTKRQLEVLDIYRKRHFANQHKMCMPPICKIERI